MVQYVDWKLRNKSVWHLLGNNKADDGQSPSKAQDIFIHNRACWLTVHVREWTRNTLESGAIEMNASGSHKWSSGQKWSVITCNGSGQQWQNVHADLQHVYAVHCILYLSFKKTLQHHLPETVGSLSNSKLGCMVYNIYSIYTVYANQNISCYIIALRVSLVTGPYFKTTLVHCQTSGLCVVYKCGKRDSRFGNLSGTFPRVPFQNSFPSCLVPRI